jgi:hypothetical protein
MYWVLFRNGVLQFYERSYYYYFDIEINTFSMFFHQRKIVNPVFKHDYYITQLEIPIIIIMVAKAKRKKRGYPTCQKHKNFG